MCHSSACQLSPPTISITDNFCQDLNYNQEQLAQTSIMVKLKTPVFIHKIGRGALDCPEHMQSIWLPGRTEGMTVEFAAYR